MDQEQDKGGFSSMKMLNLDDTTHSLLVFIAKKHSLNLKTFLDKFAIEQYQEYSKKPFHKILKK